jgi:hypothetical protein
MYHYRHIWPLAVALFIAACSSNDTLSEKPVVVVEEPEKPADSQPMVFSSSPVATTRSASLETFYTDFKVGVWKNFGNTTQQNVMDGYKVEYNATTSKWNYVGIGTQIQRYWDQSAFPYEFRAVSPYLNGATLAADKITIDVSAKPFKAQTYFNEVYNLTPAESEPCVVAQVSRPTVDISEVKMPFHHLISKIGFRIYLDDPQPEGLNYVAQLDTITISIVKTGFISESKTYTATTAQGLVNGTFSGDTTSDEFVVLKHGLFKELDNGTLVPIDLRKHLRQEDAIDLCPGYLQQIPHEDLKIRIQMQITTNDVTPAETHTYTKLLSLNRTNDAGDLFTWEPEKRYIYYLRIPNIHSHELVLETCEILSWDEVQTSDIPIEL